MKTITLVSTTKEETGRCDGCDKSAKLTVFRFKTKKLNLTIRLCKECQDD